ncbi:hypothetical protein OROGR_002333 [Orobanche gracilis]
MELLPEPAPNPPPQPPIQNGADSQPEPDSEERCSKKPKLDEPEPEQESERNNGNVEGDDEFRRVAEIVLVLSTMAAMRGGRKLTDVEVELMRVARTKLAHLCQGISPKGIVDREAIGAVIDDLGLNAMVKDQRLGFRVWGKLMILG